MISATFLTNIITGIFLFIMIICILGHSQKVNNDLDKWNW